MNRDGLCFAVTREHFLSGLAKALGFQDIQVGDEAFDAAFTVRGNDEAKVKRLFAKVTLKKLLHAQPDGSFEVPKSGGLFGPDIEEGESELRFVAGGVIVDLDRLKRLFDLFAVTLDQLCHIDSAYEDQPLSIAS